jgi:DNA-directed RNA polymerase subunit omega
MRIEEITAKALEKLNYDKYFLAKAVGKRAKEIENGAKPLIVADVKLDKHTDIALREIAEGKLTPILED